MANHASFMLDNMITAVDGGFSYDGIVSIPETGLEDVEYRPGLAGSLRDSVDRVRTTGAAISARTARVFQQKQDDHNITSESGIKEKNLSGWSLTSWDKLPEDFTEVRAEKTSISNAVQPRKTPRLRVNDEITMKYGCCPGLLSFHRASSKPIRIEDIRASYPEQKKSCEKKNNSEEELEWDVVSPVNPRQENYLRKIEIQAGLPEKKSLKERSA